MNWLDLPISMVSAATETKTIPSTAGEALDGIRSGKWAAMVERVHDRYTRALQKAEEEGSPDPVVVAKKAVHGLKTKLPAMIFSGTFRMRREDAIEAHSGILCIDADNCADPESTREKLSRDPRIQAAFISPTGSGCKALVRIPADTKTHRAGFAAARKHFKETYGIAIDEACKDPSRICYVAHDSDIFVRIEDAAVLELLPEEEAESGIAAEIPRAEPRGDLDGMMFLPKDEFTSYTESAGTIFQKIAAHEPPAMFLRGGNIAILKNTTSETGATQLDIEDLTPHAFCDEVEKYGTVFSWGKDQNSKPILRPKVLMSEREARIIMTDRARGGLPPLAMIHHCPLLVERNGRPCFIGYGYHPDLGGRYITSEVQLIKMRVDDAAVRLLELIAEFPFATMNDMARAVASIVMPALRFGGLLQCHFPVILVEADAPQAGKGTLIEATQRFYGELGELTGRRKGGVGSFDEDLSKQMLRGRSFIQIDNVREALDSQFFESALTCPFGATISARVPYRQGVSVNPNKHIFQLTSNKFETTQDLTARSCVIRLLKRSNYTWKKFEDGRKLLAHLEANFTEAISIIYSIAAHWVKEGKPRSEGELRGEGRFQEWWQVADWITQNIFELPPPLDGHDKIQRRIASATQSWVRAVGNLLKAENLLGVELSATRLVQLIDEAEEDMNVRVPGTTEQTDEDGKARRVGSLMSQLFKLDSDVEVDLYRIERVQVDEERSGHGTYTRKSYVFRAIS